MENVSAVNIGEIKPVLIIVLNFLGIISLIDFKTTKINWKCIYFKYNIY